MLKTTHMFCKNVKYLKNNNFIKIIYLMQLVDKAFLRKKTF